MTHTYRRALSGLLIALAAVFSLPAQAQDTDIDADIAFVLDVLRTDYAGWPTKTEGEREAEFDAEVALMRQRIAEDPAARTWAISMLLDWFEDEHLYVRSNIVSPPNPWADERAKGRTYDYRPAPGPDFAVTRLSDETMMVRVPSFHPDYLEEFEGLLEANHDAITSTPNLLIDLRGNSGGADRMYEKLMSYLYTRPIYGIGVEWRKSGRNAATLQEYLADGTYPEEAREIVGDLLARAAASDDDFVRLYEDGISITTYPQVYAFPKRVGILTEGAGSSGDQFAMDARFSRKVTLMGAPSAGVIDYSNVIGARAPSGDFSINWPMTRSMRLPEEPFDNVGVPVDVAYPEGVTDQIEWAKAWLESRAD